MGLQTYFPSKPLSDYVMMLWYWEDYCPPHPMERILPIGVMDLTVNLSDTPFQIYEPQNGYVSQKIPNAMVAGARTEHFLIDTKHPTSILSVWFKPGGAKHFFSASGSELRNIHLSLEDLWGMEARDLYCRLQETQLVSNRFEILEQALLDRLYDYHEDRRVIDYALGQFSIIPHPVTIAQVTDAIALSSTRFIQIFREDVGMTPKQFCRVQRFQHVTRLIATNDAAPWADIALQAGYYDQAHFNNDFRAFAGITPTEYAPQNQEHNTNLPCFEIS